MSTQLQPPLMYFFKIIVLFRILSSYINSSALIFATSNLFPCAFFNANVWAPYIIDVLTAVTKQSDFYDRSRGHYPAPRDWGINCGTILIPAAFALGVNVNERKSWTKRTKNEKSWNARHHATKCTLKRNILLFVAARVPKWYCRTS